MKTIKNLFFCIVICFPIITSCQVGYKTNNLFFTEIVINNLNKTIGYNSFYTLLIISEQEFKDCPACKKCNLNNKACNINQLINRSVLITTNSLQKLVPFESGNEYFYLIEQIDDVEQVVLDTLIHIPENLQLINEADSIKTRKTYCLNLFYK